MTSRNVMFAFPNRADEATLSSGSWETTLPLANLQNRTLGVVARTTSDANASTKLDIDLTVARYILALSLVNHNASLDALIRVRGSTVSNFASNVYDSGWIDVWPTVYAFGDIPWGEINWWDGKYSEEERAGYTQTFTHVISATLARYWRVEIDDTANADGYIQIGRLFIGGGWQPSFNMLSSATLGWETSTEIQLAKSGAEYFQRRTSYRVVQFQLGHMPGDEGMSKAFELMRRAGTDAEVLYLFDPTDTLHALRRQFLGRLRKLSPIEFPYSSATRAGFEIKELI